MSKTGILFAFIFVFLFNDLALCKDTLRTKLWYRYAAEYVREDEAMLPENIEEGESFFEDYAFRDEEIFSSSKPEESELIELLASKNILDRKVALINIMLRRIYSDGLFKTILRSYDPKDDFFIRFYRYQCFQIPDKNRITGLENELIQIISLENNETLIISLIPTLMKIERSKTVPLFARYFKTGSQRFKKVIFLALKGEDKKYLEEIKSALTKENAAGALEFIKEAELEWSG